MRFGATITGEEFDLLWDEGAPLRDMVVTLCKEQQFDWAKGAEGRQRKLIENAPKGATTKE